MCKLPIAGLEEIEELQRRLINLQEEVTSTHDKLLESHTDQGQ